MLLTLRINQFPVQLNHWFLISFVIHLHPSQNIVNLRAITPVVSISFKKMKGMNWEESWTCLYYSLIFWRDTPPKLLNITFISCFPFKIWFLFQPPFHPISLAMASCTLVILLLCWITKKKTKKNYQWKYLNNQVVIISICK